MVEITIEYLKKRIEETNYLLSCEIEDLEREQLLWDLEDYKYELAKLEYEARNI